MHPILFRIPVPNGALKLWWALAVMGIVAVVFAALAARRRDRNEAVTAAVVAVGFAAGAYALRSVEFTAPELPIYAYGVMLGISLIVGWYLTLPLATRDGLPKETMANCYVVSALAALAGSRILYIVTNPTEFASVGDYFALRNGGLVAYGGFFGGLLGSWAFLAPKRIRLLAWADDAVPSLAAGLMVTRIGCYLFGCDFGKRLPDGAPSFLKTLGTFPHWAAGTIVNGDGSPAFVRHLEIYRGTAQESELLRMNTSFPVHPTQLYESLVGLGLLVLLLWQRKHLRFRGQVFLLSVFAYGFLRFVLELWRDDVERGSYGPVIDAHVYIPACLLLFAIGFVFGISLAITNERARLAARVVSFVPVAVAYVALKPDAFGEPTPYQLSTSQVIGLTSALIAAYLYARFWERASTSPRMAMSLGDEAAIALLKRREERKDGDREEPQAGDEEGEAEGEGEGEGRGEPERAAAGPRSKPPPPKTEPEPGTT
jgi:phosphatidylglycerol:prolipoprotein diacylglycerol transferase